MPTRSASARLASLISLALCLASPGVALAQVTLPNGQVVPVDSMNGEVQLYTLFTNRGEPVDWQNDASASPDVFSPLCDFTATLLLHEAGSSLGVGWYNVVPGASTAPTTAEIHQIVPPGAAVGTTITGANIRSDPAYAGGLVGFALIRTPPHFTEARWNTFCSGCATPGNWILSVSYPSRVTDNAWYVAFEDGDTSSTSWNNDGDYNDYVFFFTGLSCAGAGQPCAVPGAVGICAQGLTECDTGGALSCVAVTTGTTERCNGADDDCDGVVDGDGLCGTGEVCVLGACRSACFEGSCGAGESCTAEGICLEDACATITCAAGERCVGGSCVGVCEGIVCPGDQVCLGGRCSDPCEGVTCGAGRVCDRGVCVEGCMCRPCATGLSCTASGECVDTACDGVSCAEPAEVCRGGSCVDACAGAVCPEGQRCTGGLCVDLPPDGDAGVGGDGGSGTMDGGSGADGGRTRPLETGGCGCHVLSRPRALGLGPLALAAALALVFSRRRRAS